MSDYYNLVAACMIRNRTKEREMRDELKDRAISLLKDTYAIGYEDGVQATNVDCGVVWEERIDAIKKDIEEHTGYRPILDSYGNGLGYKEIKLSADEIISIIDKHCGGDADE